MSGAPRVLPVLILIPAGAPSRLPPWFWAGVGKGRERLSSLRRLRGLRAASGRGGGSGRRPPTAAAPEGREGAVPGGLQAWGAAGSSQQSLEIKVGPGGVHPVPCLAATSDLHSGSGPRRLSGPRPELRSRSAQPLEPARRDAPLALSRVRCTAICWAAIYLHGSSACSRSLTCHLLSSPRIENKTWTFWKGFSLILHILAWL